MEVTLADCSRIDRRHYFCALYSKVMFELATVCSIRDTKYNSSQNHWVFWVERDQIIKSRSEVNGLYGDQTFSSGSISSMLWTDGWHIPSSPIYCLQQQNCVNSRNKSCMCHDKAEVCSSCLELSETWPKFRARSQDRRHPWDFDFFWVVLVLCFSTPSECCKFNY